MSDEKRLPTVPTENWEGLFWAYNLPLQMWKTDGGHSVLNYMPRKERCQSLESPVSPEELPQFCKNTAIVLRNLADLFELLGEGKINHVYYPDELPEDAIRHAQEEAAEANANEVHRGDE